MPPHPQVSRSTTDSDIRTGAIRHHLRQHYVFRALALGEGLPAIGRLLGHVRVGITAKYAHFREAESEMPSAVAVFRLLLLTGCWLSEIQFLRWEYVKDDCIELPDAKTGGRAVPLGPEARAVLADLPREDGNPWVIRGRLPGSHITDLQKPWRRIRARAGLEDVRIHDLRHTCASWCTKTLFLMNLFFYLKIRNHIVT